MNYFNRSLEYAASVLNGKKPACVYVKQACQRYLDDLKRSKKKDEIYFDVEAAEKVCKFLEKLPHVKGKWEKEKKLFELSDWQIFIVCNLFGFKRVDTGLRRYREAYIEVPRKNGKTFFIVGIGLYMLTSDDESGPEVYCGATTENQAYEVFAPAKRICDKEPELRGHFGIEPYKRSIVIPRTMGKFEPVIGDPGDGASPSCGIADEFHEHKNTNLVDTFATGMGAREQPLMLHITTAGSDMGGPCYEKRVDITKILNKSTDDDNVFGIIFSIDENDSWDTEEAQRKANPNYGISVFPEFLNAQLLGAIRNTGKQNTYKTKHLNLWVGASTAWMNMLAFQVCRKDIHLDSFKGQKCYVGLDLASNNDFASMAILFPNGPVWSVFVKRYLPEARLEDPDNKNRQKYKSYHTGGWLTATQGNMIDYEYIIQDLYELRKEYQILEVPYDPHDATQLATGLLSDGFPMITFANNSKAMNEPMKALETKIYTKSIQFQKDPVLMWMMGNTMAKPYSDGKIRPMKEGRDNKIDDVVALIMAVGRAIVYEDKTSVYATRGIQQI